MTLELEYVPLTIANVLLDFGQNANNQVRLLISFKKDAKAYLLSQGYGEDEVIEAITFIQKAIDELIWQSKQTAVLAKRLRKTVTIGRVPCSQH